MADNNHSLLRRTGRNVIAFAASLAVIVSLAGCSTSRSGHDRTPSATPSATPSTTQNTTQRTVATQQPEVTVHVVVNDTKGLGGRMAVVVSRRIVGAGTVQFTVKNAGTIMHEILLLPAKGRELKPGADGKVSEKGVVFSIRDIPPGATRGIILDLRAGEYELLCNLKGHYADGQHVPFKVT